MAVDYSLKTKRDEFRKSGIFYTPSELGRYMQSFLPADITEIYDPTCGHGALLELFPDNVRKYGQEINPEAIPTARSLPNAEIVHGDTLTNPAFMDHRFRAIIANPPFSLKWTPPKKDDPRFSQAPVLPPASRADFAFILHILHYLADDGVAAVIISGGLLYREAAEGRIRRWMVDKNYVDQVISIPADTFQDTGIATILLILKKSREKTAITFSDKKTGQSVTVARISIMEKNCQLTPSVWLPVEPLEPETLDPVALELDRRAAEVKRLKASINMSRLIRQIDPRVPPVVPFLDELQSVIDAARPAHEIRLKSYPVVKTR